MKNCCCRHSFPMLIVMAISCCCLLLLVNISFIKNAVVNAGKVKDYERWKPVVVGGHHHLTDKQKHTNMDNNEGDEKNETEDDDDDGSSRRKKHIEKEPVLMHIKDLRVGDKMIDINLKIVAVDTVKIFENDQIGNEKSKSEKKRKRNETEKVRKSWFLVGGDGDNYVTIRANDDSSLFRLFKTEFRHEFLDKSFALRAFNVKRNEEGKFLGDFGIELQSSDFRNDLPYKKERKARIQKIDVADEEPELRKINSKVYFQQLYKKMAVVEQSFNSIPLSSLQYTTEKLIDVMARIKSIEPIHTILKENEFLYVFNLVIIENGTEAKVTAWNVWADFFEQIFANRKASDARHHIFVKLQNVETYIKKSDKTTARFGSRILRFVKTSKIVLVNDMPEWLSDLTGKSGFCQMEIRISIGQEQSVGQKAVMGTDGVNKCQVIFPSTINYEFGQELTLKGARVLWDNSGVLTLLVDSLCIVHHDDKRIGSFSSNFAAMDYPRKVMILPSDNPSSSAANQQMIEEEKPSTEEKKVDWNKKKFQFSL